MKINIKVLCLLVIMALAVLPVFEYPYAGISTSGCSCCKDKCQSSSKCHQSDNACLCSYAKPLQVCLPKGSFLPEPQFLGFFIPGIYFSYACLFSQDVFHPPKIILS